ncbi:MAG: J domain-containing protein [Clostridia bacterium]|nr:J domain-containing protein [Clostridia bacterium]
MAKQYASAESYEAKLEKVMARLGVEKYNYNWDRFSCWIEFFYKGNLYRFEHSTENAKNHGNDVKYGSDVFAQVVLTLEDIARMTERGIYELQTWIQGLKALPPKIELPSCFAFLQFNALPDSVHEVKERYRQLCKVYHPDAGGTAEMFQKLTDAQSEAIAFLEKE